jgi:hypothetical protein
VRTVPKGSGFAKGVPRIFCHLSGRYG